MNINVVEGKKVIKVFISIGAFKYKAQLSVHPLLKKETNFVICVICNLRKISINTNNKIKEFRESQSSEFT